MDADEGRSDGGTYTLLVALVAPATVEVGSLGAVDLPAAHYAYTGSALGPGGFARVERHREVAAGDRDVRHWHVDSLLGLEAARVTGAVRSPGADAECAVARGIGDEADTVAGFGATDCDCASHLAYEPDRGALGASVRAAHEAAAGPHEPVVDSYDGDGV